MAAAPRAVRSGETLANLLPAGIACAEAAIVADDSDLFAEERTTVQASVPRRRWDYAAGRRCARFALAELGVPPQALLSDDQRRPIWPEGIVGSITHGDGYCAAAVAQRRLCEGLGIDVERIDSVENETWPLIATDVERVWLGSRPPADRPGFAALLFSAKEAFYKCQHPLTGEWLEFHDVEIQWESADHLQTSGAFTVLPTRPIELTRRFRSPLRGRYRVEQTRVMTAIALEARR